MATGNIPIGEPGAHLATARLRFRKILVMTDFSAHSLRAQEVAVSLASRFGAKMISLHVISPLAYTPGAEVAWSSLVDSAANDARCQMEEALEAVPGWRDLRHEELVETGSLLDALEHAIEEHHVDLVICGSHGAAGMERALLGSTAEMILRHISAPVMVVGPHCDMQVFEGRSIVLSTSLGLGSFRPAQYAAALAEELNARLTVLHLANTPDREVSEELVRHRLCNEARSLLPMDAADWCHLKVCVLFGENAGAIAALAARERADLIVMGVHEVHLSQLADHMPSGALAETIRAANCPVLAVRGHYTD